MAHLIESHSGTFIKEIFKFIANICTPKYHNYRLWNRKSYWLRRAGLKVGRNVAIDRKLFVLQGCESNVEVGDHSAIGVGCKIWPFNKVIIGKFNMFAANVELTNGGHDINTLEPYSKPLIIGNGCWIGHGVKIIGGVNIGNNVVIGAGAVVIEDIPDNAVAVGVPTRIIKYRELPPKVWHLGNDYYCPASFELIEELEEN